jgi:hypothetical protein
MIAPCGRGSVGNWFYVPPILSRDRRKRSALLKNILGRG